MPGRPRKVQDGRVIASDDLLLRRRTVTVTEFAAIVGVSRSLAYQLVTEGRIHAVKVNRRIVIPLSAIDRFLEDTASARESAQQDM